MEFGTNNIQLEKCCFLFGMSHDEAKRAASRQKLPVPTFRLGSQKSPWLISAETLAVHINTKKAASEVDWRKLNATQLLHAFF
jgi:hypothetical protein